MPQLLSLNRIFPTKMFTRDEWIILLTKGFPLEFARVFTHGPAGVPMRLRDALIVFDKLYIDGQNVLEQFRLHGKRPVAELISSWALLSKQINKKLYVTVPLAIGAPFVLDIIYMVSPNHHPLIYNSNGTITELRLAKY